MKFVDIYLNVLKDFGNFKTRSNRADFWIFAIVNILVSAIIGWISSNLSFIYSLIITVPSLAVGARRMHDIGKSGWTQLWMLLPIIGWIYLIYLCILESQPEANKWGSIPEATEF